MVKRRVRQALMVAGIGEDEGAEARSLAETEAVAAALRFARRRLLGPFAMAAPDPKARQKALAAMVRAGHRFTLAQAIIDRQPGSDIDIESFADSC